MTSLSRRDLLQATGAATAFLVVGGVSRAVWAKRKKSTQVVWKDVVLPDDKRRRRREGVLRSVLRREGKRAEWGDWESRRVEASVKVVEFRVDRRAEVVRVTCTAFGKLTNGPSVRTHFSLGDHPKRQTKLEKMVLTLVARGVVTRLAAIARDRANRETKKKS